MTDTVRMPKTQTRMTGTLISVWISAKANPKGRTWMQAVYLKGDCRKHKWSAREGGEGNWTACLHEGQQELQLAEGSLRKCTESSERQRGGHVYLPTDCNASLVEVAS